MAPHLRVLAGTSLDSLVPLTTVNTNQPFAVKSELFEGEIVANIKGFTNDDGDVIESEYFARPDRQGITWSIAVQGRFLKEYTADDIMFGNTFERPLTLPWGSSVAFKFMKWVDPTLEHELTSSTKPWALSPLISTMPHFAHHRGSDDPPFPPAESLVDDTSQLHLAASGDLSPTSSASSLSSSGSTSSGEGNLSNPNADKVYRSKSKARRERHDGSFKFTTATQRRACFSNADNRCRIRFGPEDVITCDFCYGFIEFSPTLSLRLPGGVSFDLMKYWDGQPVRFVCCERKDPNVGGDPWGKVLWCVVVELVDNA